jgi:hypothetical protein
MMRQCIQSMNSLHLEENNINIFIINKKILNYKYCMYIYVLKYQPKRNFIITSHLYSNILALQKYI